MERFVPWRGPVSRRALSFPEAKAPKSGDVPGSTNTIALESLVAEVLERNPELKFYTAEITAAKGERRTAGIWANPEAATTFGDKRVRDGSLAGEGVAWPVLRRGSVVYP